MQAMVPYEEESTQRVSSGRMALVCVGACLLASAFPSMLVLEGRSLPGFVWALSLVGFASVWMFRSRSLFAHILARAVWVQSLGLGILLTLGTLFGSLGGSHLKAATFMLTIGGFLALFGAGRHGLERLSSRFAPTAFRASLMTSLVMAMADTGSLLFYGGIALEDNAGVEEAIPFFVCAAVMMVALHGLYRLKLWGLALNIVANVAIAGIALSGILDLPNVLAYGLAATALIQLMIPAPLIRAMIRA